jgi:hypothetical protein
VQIQISFWKIWQKSVQHKIGGKRKPCLATVKKLGKYCMEFPKNELTIQSLQFTLDR